MAEKSLLATITGEHFQPVRLHYRVADPERLQVALRKLRCVERDQNLPRFVWLYDYEAMALTFKNSYAKIPKHLHPMVIGSIFIRTKDEMLIDLRSCERAIHAVEFFAKHIARDVAEVTEADVVNKLFPVAGNEQLTPDKLFDRVVVTRRDPEAEILRLTESTAHIRDPNERLRVVAEAMMSNSRKPLPEIESVPVHFHDDGISGFAAALRMRQTVALQHWIGNTSYSARDAMEAIIKRSGIA